MRYAIVIENAGGDYSAYVPDLRVASQPATHLPHGAGYSRSIEFHLDGLREDGTPIPLRPAASSMLRSPPNNRFERSRGVPSSVNQRRVDDRVKHLRVTSAQPRVAQPYR